MELGQLNPYHDKKMLKYRVCLLCGCISRQPNPHNPHKPLEGMVFWSNQLKSCAQTHEVESVLRLRGLFEEEPAGAVGSASLILP